MLVTVSILVTSYLLVGVGFALALWAQKDAHSIKSGRNRVPLYTKQSALNLIGWAVLIFLT